MTRNDSEHSSMNPYSYRGFADRQSLMAAFGVAVMVLGCALASFASLLPAMDSADSTVISEALDNVVRLATKDLLQTNFAGSHAIATVLLISFVIIGSWLLGRAKKDREAFCEAYPQLEISFSEDELRRYGHLSRSFMTSGAIIIAAAIAVGIYIHGFANLYTELDSPGSIGSAEAVENGAILVFIAIGCWLLIRGKTLHDIPDMMRYNYKALESRNVYEMDRDSTGKLNSRLLHAREVVARKVLANHIITIVGIIAALALYFLPSLETRYFWLALVGALVACKIVSWRAYKKVCAIFNMYT